jgi:hypothetical protein
MVSTPICRGKKLAGTGQWKPDADGEKSLPQRRTKLKRLLIGICNRTSESARPKYYFMYGEEQNNPA